MCLGGEERQSRCFLVWADSLRRPWWIILAWVVAAAAVISLAPKLTSSSDEASFLPEHYESIRAADVQEKEFHKQRNVGAIIVFQRSDGGKLTAADSADVKRVSRELQARKIPDVEAVVPGEVSPNKQVQTFRSWPCRRSPTPRTPRPRTPWRNCGPIWGPS
ncbi:hypothetical protein SALBM135S_09170 [Streptomyces alboniger]